MYWVGNNFDILMEKPEAFRLYRNSNPWLRASEAAAWQEHKRQSFKITVEFAWRLHLGILATETQSRSTCRQRHFHDFIIHLSIS